MADTYGGTAIPLAAAPHGQPVADPALGIVLGYLAAYLNSKCAAAWNAIVAGKPVVANAFAYNPQLYPINAQDLPAMYLFRGDTEGRLGGERIEDIAADYRQSEDTLTLLWIYPSPQVSHLRRRDSFVNGLAKAIDLALTIGRDPVYVAPGDTDSSAPTYAADTDAIKVPFATQGAPVTYSGAALNGVIGASTFAAPRPFSVTADRLGAPFPAGAKVRVRGNTELGVVITAELAITVDFVPETFTTQDEFTSILEVSIDALAPGGFMELGLGPRAGCGSIVVAVAGLEDLDVVRWQSRALSLRTGDGSQVLSYDALEVTLRARELLRRDNDAEFTAFADAADGVAATLDLTNGDGVALESDSYEN